MPAEPTAVEAAASEAPASVEAPTVALADAASTEPAATAEPPAPSSGARRVTAVEGFEKIRLKPQWDAPNIGLFRAGQAVRIKDGPLEGPGVAPCAGGWYAIEPRGYVCVGPASTLAEGDPRALAAAELLPSVADEPYHYGVSVGAPRYLRIPTKAEQRQTEEKLDAYLAHLPLPDDAKGGAIDATPAGKPPSPAIARALAVMKRPLVDKLEAAAGEKIAWATELDAEGRTFLVTPDFALVPKDKIRVGPHTALRGIELDSPGMKLPLGFVWLGAAPKLTRGEHGKLVDTGETWAHHSFVPLTEGTARGPGGIYIEARDGGFVRNDLVTVIRPSPRPHGVGVAQKWVSVRVTRGYLVAYEGDKPVFATAVSPGMDGINPGPHATKRGRYAIEWKLLSFDMSGTERNGDGWIVEEVPWVAYYKESYALHGAFWHDEFGRPKSHGCVNLPPADARRLFAWLDPALPEGWYAVASFPPAVKGTVIDVRP